MAEERLIDDDKDRKYKIRKNADGEDELVLDTEQTEEPQEEIEFEVPEIEEDDEEAAVMTPEQLAERKRRRAEEEKKREEELKKIAAHALSLIEKKKFEDAGYLLKQVEDENGLISALKLRALTCDFTDFSKTEEGFEAVNGINNSAEAKEMILPFVQDLKTREKEAAAEIESLTAENELKKGERRVAFTKKRNISLGLFAATALPLIAFAVLAIYFSTIMYAEKDGSNITLFIIFVSLAGAFFLATVFTAKYLWKNLNNLKLNEKNSSTKLGRKLEADTAGLKLIRSILEIYRDDIS